MFRGGSWDYDAASCRSAYRSTNDPTYRTSNLRLPPGPESVRPEVSGARSRKEGAEPAGVGTEGASAEQRPEMP